ncbi:NAD-dependent epimerase/dehydratase family protein [Vibrio profundi]|uniref:NAD-dependent epimerase/dehydratase family protein n=1 Tax=Vibrio profundi TaxID=1774960 RepID=UPI00373631A0
MKSIVIIGAGWLGQPLAKHLINLKHSVCATKTTDEGSQALVQENIPSHTFQFNIQHPETSINQLTELLREKHADTIIGCFPPGFRKGAGDEYAQYWEQVVQSANLAQVSQIVMVSSSTVYPNLAKKMYEHDASLELSEKETSFSDNAKIMLQAEEFVIQSGLQYNIVRCSGLVGSNRHPSRFVSKLKQVSSSAPANMLHLKDAVGAVAFTLTQTQSCILNATTPKTVSKAEYYQAALVSVGSDSPLPKVVSTPDKEIMPDKIQALGYQFHYQSTLETLHE